MSQPLDELYFQWLYRQVGDPSIKNPTRTYWRMLRVLYTKEFAWVVPNDDNRVEDGKELRYEFVDDAGLEDVDIGWISMGCSMLELLIGLSRRLAFEAEGEPRGWFWTMMENISLGGFTDDRMGYGDHIPTRYTDQYINDVLDRIIWRTYERDGHGGLFPLSNPTRDQRKVELWYQLSAYVLELLSVKGG